MATYSFKDVNVSIAGIAGTIQLGMGAGVAEEGITIERTEDRNTMTLGADGEVMHSLHVADGGTVRVRLLKTSPVNGRLMDLYKQQRRGSLFWGRNTISVQDRARNDRITASEVAFMGEPALSYGKVGNVNEWSFHAGHVEGTLDSGVPPPTV